MLIRPKGGRDENIQSSKCPGNSRTDFGGVHLSRVPPIQAGTQMEGLGSPTLAALVLLLLLVVLLLIMVLRRVLL